MRTYKIFFTETGAMKHNCLIEFIKGYSEDDALYRAGISRDEITKIIHVQFALWNKNGTMNKADRQKVFDMYGGKCAYCGCELAGKWCVDHIEPIFRKHKLVGGYKNVTTGAFADNNTVVDESFYENYKHQEYKRVANGCEHPELDTIENAMPSCFSCNHYKSTMDLELFREQISLLVSRLNKSSTQYKIAKRFGLIQETGIVVKFYFETLKSPDTKLNSPVTKEKE